MSQTSNPTIQAIINGTVLPQELTSTELWYLIRNASEPEKQYLQTLLESSLSGRTLAQGLDAAGRSEVALADSTGDYLLTRDALPLFFDTVESGTATGAYEAATNSWAMTVTTTDDYAIFSTKQYHPYFTGRAQQPEVTYINLEPETDVVKRVGYFSSSTVAPHTASLDGIYLESSSGTVKLVIAKEGATTVIEQADWDRYQTGIDWTKFNVTAWDFLYLRGTSVTLRQLFGGAVNTLARHDHANLVADVILGSPAQPLRAEIRSSGGAGSLKFVCGSVQTGGLISDQFGTPVSADTGDGMISLGTAGTEYMVLALRKTDPTAEFFVQNVDVSMTSGANNLFRWRLHLNPSLSAGITYGAISGAAGAPLEISISAATAATTISGAGHVIASGSGAARATSSNDISKALRIGVTVAGVYDQLVLSCVPYANSEDITGSIQGFYI
jgi:hypothetical protein